jgi:hypothetical protein
MGDDSFGGAPPVADASVDVTVPVVDAASPDAAPPESDAGLDAPPEDAHVIISCTPSLTGAPAPSWKPPSTYPRAACSAAEITQIVTDCYAQLSASKCAADKAAMPACAACLITDETAASLGPIIQAGAYGTLNQAGCQALETGDASPSGCPARIGVVIDCEQLACAARCTTAGSNSTQYHSCRLISSGDGGPCAAAYAQTTGCGEDDPDAGGRCYFGATDTFLTYMQRVAPK